MYYVYFFKWMWVDLILMLLGYITNFFFFGISFFGIYFVWMLDVEGFDEFIFMYEKFNVFDWEWKVYF